MKFSDLDLNGPPDEDHGVPKRYYRWFHLPSGANGYRVISGPLEENRFLRMIDRWNRSNPTVWHYHSVSEEEINVARRVA
jgi:hypothetical protein